jgi:hypothetical protein
VPAVDRLAEALAFPLEGEVDDRRRPSAGRTDRADTPVVDGRVPAKRGVEVRVDVDRAREDVLAGGVDPLAALDRKGAPDLDDLAAVDENVRLVGAGGRDHGAACDQRLHVAIVAA